MYVLSAMISNARLIIRVSCVLSQDLYKDVDVVVDPIVELARKYIVCCNNNIVM